MCLVTIADGKAAASWVHGKQNCKKNSPESAFRWVLIGWAPGLSLIFWGLAKGWFLKGWGCWMFPGTKNRNEGTFGCFSAPKTGMRVHADVPWYRKPERGYIAKTALLRNRTFVSSRIFVDLDGILCPPNLLKRRRLWLGRLQQAWTANSERSFVTRPF